MNLLKDTEGTQLLGICKVLRAKLKEQGPEWSYPLVAWKGKKYIGKSMEDIAISVPKGYPTMEIPRCFPSWFPHRQASIQFLPGFGCSAEMAMFTRIPFATPVGLTNQQQQHFLLTCQATFNNMYITTSDKDILW